MKHFSQKKFLLKIVMLTLVFVVFFTIPYAIGKWIDPIGDSPLYPGGPTFPSGSLPVVNVSVPNQFTSGTTISASAMNNNFKAIGNQMPGIDWATINKTDLHARPTATVGTVSISAPCSGYVVVRFDGYAIADETDLIVLAASDTTDYGSSRDEKVFVYGDGRQRSFSHTRVYTVDAVSKTFYALVRNDSGPTGLVSVYGTLTATFYPNKY